MRGFAAEPIKVVRGDSELFRRSYGPKTLENHQKHSFTVVRLLFTGNRIPPKCAGIVGRPDGTGPRSFRGVLRELGSENVEKTPKSSFTVVRPLFTKNRISPKSAGIHPRTDKSGPGSFRAVPEELWPKNGEKVRLQ